VRDLFEDNLSRDHIKDWKLQNNADFKEISLCANEPVLGGYG
jgi:hypothetical protein